MNPLVFAPFVAAVAAVSWRKRPAPGSADEARRMLVSTIAPAAVYFLLHALHDRVQGNWLAPLFPACGRSRRRLGRAGAARGAVRPEGRIAMAALWAAPLGFAVMVLGFVAGETGVLPLGAADPTARLEGFRDLARDLDARARAGRRAYVLTQGYALTSLMTYYGDPGDPIVQPEQRIRWIFEPSPPESLFAAPGLALAEAGRRFDLDAQDALRSVEPAGRLERRAPADASGLRTLPRRRSLRAGARSALPERRGRSARKCGP